MARRKIASYASEESAAVQRSAAVYRDSEYQEYVVKFYKNGTLLEDANYHTDDKTDACDTAKSWV